MVAPLPKLTNFLLLKKYLSSKDTFITALLLMSYFSYFDQKDYSSCKYYDIQEVYFL